MPQRPAASHREDRRPTTGGGQGRRSGTPWRPPPCRRRPRRRTAGAEAFPPGRRGGSRARFPRRRRRCGGGSGRFPARPRGRACDPLRRTGLAAAGHLPGRRPAAGGFGPGPARWERAASREGAAARAAGLPVLATRPRRPAPAAPSRPRSPDARSQAHPRAAVSAAKRRLCARPSPRRPTRPKSGHPGDWSAHGPHLRPTPPTRRTSRGNAAGRGRARSARS